MTSKYFNALKENYNKALLQAENTLNMKGLSGVQQRAQRSLERLAKKFCENLQVLDKLTSADLRRLETEYKELLRFCSKVNGMSNEDIFKTQYPKSGVTSYIKHRVKERGLSIHRQRTNIHARGREYRSPMRSAFRSVAGDGGSGGSDGDGGSDSSDSDSSTRFYPLHIIPFNLQSNNSPVPVALLRSMLRVLSDPVFNKSHKTPDKYHII